MAGLVSLDEQLADLVERRANCLDLLCRCLVDLDAMAARADVLLDRKLAGDGPLIEPDCMT